MGHIISTYYGDISLAHRQRDIAVPWLPHRCVFTGKWLMPFKPYVRWRHLVDGKPCMILYLEYSIMWTTEEELIMQGLYGNL